MEVTDLRFSASCGDVFQDSQGFLWFAAGGLLRFDGHEVKLFKHQPDDSNSLGSNYVSRMLEDDNGNIWIATLGGGLNFFDRKTERFSSWKHQLSRPGSICNDYCNVLFLDHKKQLWIGTNDGLCLMESDEDGQVKGFKSMPENGSLSHPEVSAIVEYPEGVLWISTQRGGLNRYDTQTGELEVWKRDKDNPHSLAGNIVKHLYLEPHGEHMRLWAATFGGLCYGLLDKEGNLLSPGFTHYRFPELVKGLTWFSIDKKGNYWLGTRKEGLIQIKPDSQFIRYKPSLENPASISGNVIWEVFEDNEGNLWIAGESGIDKMPRHRAIFRQHTIDPSLGLPETANSITAMEYGPEGKLWIGTEGEGLVIWDKKTNFWKQIKKAGTGLQLVHSIVTDLLFEGDTVLWVATYGGLSRLDLKRRQSQHFTEDDEQGLTDNHIFAMYKDQDGLLWLGTRGGGLNYFDYHKNTWGSFRHHPDSLQGLSNNYIWHIIPEENQGFWLATDNGIEKMNWDPAARKAVFSHFSHEAGRPQSLSNNYVNFLHKSANGSLWVGTSGGGLNRLDSMKGEQAWFTHFKKQDGLADNTIYAILEDNSGNLWISTDRGISTFNPGIEDPNGNAFSNFGMRDGLLDEEFNMGGYAKDPMGYFYFGGLKGFHSFHPDSISSDASAPELAFTKLEIINQTIRPSQKRPWGNIPISQSINEASEIRLSHRDYVFSISFSVLNYQNPAEHRYAYKLEGFDEEWNAVGNKHRATYTNLNPGTYLFHVKGSDAQGSWNEQGKKILIHIAPPPWRSWWAICLYILGIAGLIWWITRSYAAKKQRELKTKLQIEQARLEERERVRKKSAADFHDELGNKVTKIGLFVELARQKTAADPELHDLFGKISANSNQLADGVRDFIWVTDPEKDSLYEILNRIKRFGDELFEYSDVIFEMDSPEESWKQRRLSIDERRHLLLIFKEALNNSLKYAEASRVSFLVKENDEHVSLCLKDNGKGFDTKQPSAGYGLANMHRRAEKIGADLQVSSQKGEGSSVCVVTKIPHMRD